MPTLNILKAGPSLTVQDHGRPGWKAQGLSTGGAADPLALLEAAALLGTDPRNAGIEMMGIGGRFQVDEGTRIALTGAMMDAEIDGVPLAHNATTFLPAGATLSIGAAKKGVYGYLSIAGGIATHPVLNSRAAHLTAGIGAGLNAGETLAFGADPDRTRAPQKLPASARLGGGMIRVMQGPQTDFFARESRDAFAATTFTRNPRGNRQGIRLDYGTGDLGVESGLTYVSDLIVPGDIQIAGQGVPFILLAECQTIGGYPRIGSVVPADLPCVAQAAAGTALQFRFVTVEEADQSARTRTDTLRDLTRLCQPAIRDPHDIADLLRYQLISGATRGDDLEGP